MTKTNKKSKWLEFQQLLDLKGGVWVAIYSWVMLIALIYTLVTSKPLPSTALTLYGTVLGAFVVNKTAVKISGNGNSNED